MEVVETGLQTAHGPFQILCYDEKTGQEPDFALVRGKVGGKRLVKVRVQSECHTGHVLHSLSCDCYEQLQDPLSAIAEADEGVVIYLRQEGRAIGLADKVRTYILQKMGDDTVDANLRLGHAVDERTYEATARIIRILASCPSC